VDVHEIIGPLVQMKESGRTGDILAFTRMTGDLVRAMRHCPQPIVAAIDGVCAGAGRRSRSPATSGSVRRASKVAFLFSRVGLSGADMGACALLPRVDRAWPRGGAAVHGSLHGRGEADRWGSSIASLTRRRWRRRRATLAQSLAEGPTFATR
jgi:enoyl-CoA hydratase/carnithine racemase